MATRASSKQKATPHQRLERYRAKRDFSITAEPSGAGDPPEPGQRFVVQRHRARRLHYDLRLEAGGVLVSWAVPKGPTLDPDVRRMAVHVEDHPVSYFDFEGIIAGGQYGAGDVIVWDWGSWTPAKEADPLAAVDAGELHFDLEGEKLRGRFVLVRTGERGARESWLLLHKRDEFAEAGWDAEDHPRSVKSGRTNDEVKAAPSATWSSRAEWVGPTPDELASLDALGRQGEWSIGGRTVKLTNLDKVLFPAARRRRALTKRDLVRHHAVMAPLMLPYLHDRAVNLHRFPDGAGTKGFWQKAAPKGAPDWIPRWHYEDADPGETQHYLVLDSPGALVWAAQNGAIELHPWTSSSASPHEPTWAMIDIDPGTGSGFDDAVVLARLYRAALEHLGIDGRPKVTGKRGLQIWVPVAAGHSFDDTRTFVEKVSRAVGATVPDMISWEWETAKRGGRTRLDYTQNAVNKTLVAPFSARPEPAGPVSVPIEWAELDDPKLRSDRWTIHDVAERAATAGDPLAPLVGLQQQLPAL